MGKHVKKTPVGSKISAKGHAGYDGRIDLANFGTFVQKETTGNEKTVLLKGMTKYCDWLIGNLEVMKEGFHHLASNVAAVTTEAIEG